MEEFLIYLIPILLLILFLSLFIVEQQKVAVIQRFGKFARISTPGLNVKIPFIEEVAGKVNLRIQQLDVTVETKTADNVFVKVMVSVQYSVNPNAIYEAFYKLQNHDQQIKSFVFDVVRAKVPTISLDDVFEKKDDVAKSVKQELSETMDNLGYQIIKTLVTDIDPDKKVKESMNEINAAQRLRVAATEKGEAERILKVKVAQGEAESQSLQGQGIANQRTAIISGLKESVEEFQRDINGVNHSEVMNIVLLTQYFDTLKDMGKNSNTNTVMLPHSPGAMGNMMDQIRDTIISSNEVKNNKSPVFEEEYLEDDYFNNKEEEEVEVKPDPINPWKNNSN